MADEKTFTVPLRRGFQSKPPHKRTNRAVKVVRAFLSKHMKVPEEDVRIGQHLNEHLWQNGIRNPPPRVKVTVKKEDGKVLAELEGKTYKGVVKPQAATEEPTGLKEKLQAAIGKKDDEAKE